uniref:Uncharacterized protein n=1 Tax=Tanacetum cinerariifolium TaxID=118510 RepID=A0A6L2LU98_TANCI|nr:hypothetical protein [Tanacetum cinerariifolium]
MTDNISYLSEYEPYDGGYVSFRQGRGKITGKGIIKTDFKLKDYTNVLLRTHRQHNMYSIDLNNIVPHKNLTCLVVKASANESMLWYRRLGHLNFKTMNKLVRNNLVKGLPSKCFENDHTCVACLKGKQHKASCKTKLVNSMSKTLYTLHMGLFGPTFVSSHNHKWYCLVVTDDFSRVAERRNRTLIEAARTMLADAKLPVTFWVEAVNTACYVQNKVLVNKSQNKNSYELFNSRTLAIGFLRPFGCHVMILNTLDHLGKFDAKGDEGYFVGYFIYSKAFRVFNKRTKKVEENLHVDVLENKLIEKRAGPNWLFDIDTLTNSMNYVLVVIAGTSSTNISGRKDVASQAVKKDVSSLRYIALPNWFHEAHMESSNSDAQDACNVDVPECSGIFNPTATSKIPLADQMESLTVESKIPTFSLPVLTICLDNSPETLSDSRLISKGVFSQEEIPSLDNALTLSNQFEDIIRVEADLSNIESSIPASPTPTFRIHKDHPKSQIISLVDTHVQTRHKSKEIEEHSFIATIHQKTNHDLLQFCLFLCFLSQEEPKKIFDALKDPRWKEGFDYKEVFAPVARIEAIRLFLAYASFMGFIVYQMDVKSAFLYGIIDEEVYVMQPPGFQDPEFLNRVYKVEKKLAFCDYHNMIAILEKIEHNINFHQIVDFLEASHIRTISESSLRRHIKLNDEEGISSLPDTELFENLSLMGYNILPNQRFTFQEGQFSHQWKFLIHTIMQCLCPKSTGYNEFSSNIATAVVCLATNKELMELCTSLQRQQTQMAAKIKAQDLEISGLKARVKFFEDKDRGSVEPSQEDAPSKGGLCKKGKKFCAYVLKEEGERIKRKRLKLDQWSAKRIKTSEDVSEEDLKEMVQLVPIEEVYVEALQFDREDLHQLWILVKETLSIKQATNDKEKELWVELKRLFEPDFKDQ